MKNQADFNKRFLINTEDSGRFIVTSLKTNKKYYIEPIGKPYINWGDVNPSTGQIEGDYGDKYRGSIDAKDSLITEENGFDKIHMLGAGVSPLGYIDMLEGK